MKKVFTILLSLLMLVFGITTAQTPTNSIIIDAASFRPVQTDALTGIAIDKIGLDRSKNQCSRIKMRINRMTREEIGELSIRFRNATIELMKQRVATEGDGLIFEMTAKSEVRFYLRHPKFGESNEVTLSIEPNKEYYIEASLNQLYPITIASNTADAEVYIDDEFKGRTNTDCVLMVSEVLPGEHRLRLVYGGDEKVQTINVNSGSVYFKQEVDIAASQPRYVVFKVEPKTAVVTIDGTILPLDPEGGTHTTLKQGTYRYSVEEPEYHSESGNIVVGSTTVKKVVTLRPAFGWLNIDGASIEGAAIYVDNKLKGSAPLNKAIRLASGQHSVQIIKRKYKNYTTNVAISDSQTTTLTPALESNFATVSLTADSGTEIWIDNEKRGVGSWSGELELGSHIVESRKVGHRPSMLSLDVATSTALKHTLPAPTPITGSLNIVSSPIMAEVLVDGRKMGETPYTHSSLLIGEHRVELRMSNYATWSKDITITEGQTVNLNATLSKQSTTPDFCEMVYVEGGTFTMGATSEQGSSASNEKPTHSVTVSNFYIGKYEVTQKQWKEIMGTNPSRRKGDNLPVERVSWNDIHRFIQKLKAKTGKKYRLPTEAEWEYAARGGNKSQGYKYSGSNNIDEVAWCLNNARKKTQPVGQKRPNELGIYDMSGNVYEWCQDWYGSYSSSSQTNPTGPYSGPYRVVRGGSSSYDAGVCHVSNRSLNAPSNRSNNHGFRLVLDTPTTEPYKVGDYYNFGGKEGVVFEVTPDGKHGKIVALDDLGEMSWYEAKRACANLGNGWYLPTKEELLKIMSVEKTLNPTIAIRGGRKLFVYGGSFWSSTERDEYPFRAAEIDMFTTTHGVHYSEQDSDNYVRAVAAF